MLKPLWKIVVIETSYLKLSIFYTVIYFKNRNTSKGEKMKLEELIAPCPKCGSKDKIAHRKMLDNHRAHAEMETVKCEECGYIFFVNENMDPDEKKQLLNELNKIHG